MRLFLITHSKQCCNLLDFGIPGNELTIFDQIGGSDFFRMPGNGKKITTNRSFFAFLFQQNMPFVSLFKEK